MWRIEQLKLTDFKSYKGTHVIPQLRNFQAVIGPNGAGKSNLMDAISFVLGVRVGYLRGSNLKDLIHDDPTMASPPSRAAVELQLRHSNGDVKVFGRTVLGSGSSEYRLNGRIVSEREYQTELRDINIDVKARNFLVFQGDVTQVATKSGKELTKMVESICGSDELAREYDELKAKKERAEEQTMACFQKKKGMAAEKKQYKAMKEEAERYQQLEAELVEKKTDLMLVEIRNYKKGMGKYKNEMKGKERELESLLNEKTEKEGQYEEAMNAVRAKVKEENGTRDVLRRLKGEREQLKPVEGRVSAKKRVMAEKVRALEREIEQLRARGGEEQDRIDEIEGAIKEKEQEAAQLQHAESVKLTDAQQQEFDRQCEEYQCKYGDKERRRVELEHDIERDEQTVKDLSKVESVRALDEQIESMRLQVGRYRESLAQEQKGLSSEKEELQHLRESVAEKSENVERCSRELKEVEQAMSDLRMSMKESRHDVVMNDTLDSLKRLFSKVHGQVSELYTPVNKKEAGVLAMAIGKYNKAVVVEDTQTALECLRYCKEQRSKVVLTFLCLRELRTKDFNEMDETLKEMGATFAIKSIKYNDRYESVFRFVLNNTIIVDTLKSARKIAFNKRYQHKFRIITSLGSVVEKNALMAGGVDEKRKKVNAKKAQEQYAELSSRKQQLEEELRNAQDLQVSDVDEAQLRVNGHAQRIEVLRRRMDEVEAAQKKAESEKAEIEKKTGGKDLKEVRRRVRDSKKELEGLTAELAQAQHDVFADLNGQLGISDVYAQCAEVNRKAREVRGFEIARELEVLRERLRLESEKGSSTERMEKENELAQLRLVFEQEVENKEAEVRAKLEENAKSSEEATSELARIMREMERMKVDVADKKKSLEEADAAIRQNQKDQSHLQSMHGKLQAGLDETVRTARMEQIPLPLTGEDRTQSTKVSMDLVTRSTTAGDQDFDFSRISKMVVRNMEEYTRVRSELQEEVKRIEVQINGLTPNMKAIDQFNGIVDKLKGINDDFDETRKAAKEAADAFAEVRSKRTKMFMEAFEHISNTIDPIYKELTRSAKHPLGGTAYLSLENTEEPYLSGLRYSAMPPFKRFHDLEQLSGGEKTIAALALLFAIQSYYPSPFFILDEIDAALDVQNVLQVAKYIQKKCGDVQFLVISLKDTLYERADALVGVARDLERKTSVTYTLDLKEYELQ